MNLKNELGKIRENMKNISGKAKLQYIWNYFKWHIIIVVFLLSSVGIVIYHAFADPEVALNGMFLNAYGIDSEEPLDNFVDTYMKDREMNADEEIVDFNISFQYTPNDTSGVKNYEVINGLSAWIKNETVDVVVADETSMVELVEASYFMNLSEVLTAQQLAKYSSKIISVKGVPMFIDVRQCDNLSKVFLDQHEVLALGVAKGAPHIEEIRAFIDYLMQ